MRYNTSTSTGCGGAKSCQLVPRWSKVALSPFSIDPLLSDVSECLWTSLIFFLWISRQSHLTYFLGCVQRFFPENIGHICETCDSYTAISYIRPPSVLCQSSNSMSSSISEFPPVAKLCSNCQKAQLQDNVPQLFRDGSRLEFDKEQILGSRNLGIIPTEFELVDSFPGLSKLVKSCQDGCDFCSFLHEAITFKIGQHKSNSSTWNTVFVAVSYMWGLDRYRDESCDKWQIGLNAMRITLEFGCDKRNPESIFRLDCEVQSLCREYSPGLAQHAGTQVPTSSNR